MEAFVRPGQLLRGVERLLPLAAAREAVGGSRPVGAVWLLRQAAQSPPGVVAER